MGCFMHPVDIYSYFNLNDRVCQNNVPVDKTLQNSFKQNVSIDGKAIPYD